MQAIILAAGKGLRLQPLTEFRSKAMLPILGKPIVERVMAALESSGINEFILVINPDDKEIAHHFREAGQIRSPIHYVYQDHAKGMADALRYAAPLIRGDFILSACDNLFPDEHIDRILSLWRAKTRPNALLTLMPIEADKISSAGIVTLDGDWVTDIVEKPALSEAPSNIASLPLYCLPQEILGYLPEILISIRGEYELQDAIQLLIKRQGSVMGVMVENRFTLTSPADLLEINRHLLKTGAEATHLKFQSIGVNTCLVTPLYIEGGTQIGRHCCIGPNVYIERGCVIGDNVEIANSVILRGSEIPDGTIFSDQIATI